MDDLLASLVAQAKSTIALKEKAKKITAKVNSHKASDAEVAQLRETVFELQWEPAAHVFRETVFICRCGSAPFGGPVQLFTRHRRRHGQYPDQTWYIAADRSELRPTLPVETDQIEHRLEWCTDCLPSGVRLPNTYDPVEAQHDEINPASVDLLPPATEELSVPPADQVSQSDPDPHSPDIVACLAARGIPMYRPDRASAGDGAGLFA